LQKVQTEVDESALSMLRSPQPAPIELILTTLINEIRAYEEGFDLILDDYHIIDARPIHSAITFLLDYLPPHTLLIIAGRSDPPLPLSACVMAANLPRFEFPTCASPLTRRRFSSTKS
jgi:LuxR family maltose regulon positive regulatory protein